MFPVTPGPEKLPPFGDPVNAMVALFTHRGLLIEFKVTDGNAFTTTVAVFVAVTGHPDATPLIV